MASPTRRSPRVQLAAPYARTARSTRRPQHRFSLVTKPFQIQPFMVAPVLPGETLKLAMLQSQVWSDPLKASLKNLGWWCEYNFWYVKHRDLMGFEEAANGLGDVLVEMFTTGASLAGFVDADGNEKTYCPPGGVDFVLSALQRITEEYYRDEGEVWNIATLDGLPLAKIYGKGQSDWSEKLTDEADHEDRRQNLDIDGDGEIYTNEIARAWNEWAAAHDAGLITMDYEDWMRTYGGGAVVGNDDRVDYHRPEDIAHFREFTYPTNTVEPTTGVPTVAAGWRVASQARKAVFFPEPGWIIGTTVVRPKIYLGKQQGNIASMMQTRDSWLPAILNDQMNVSHLRIPEDVGPLAAQWTASDYWIDLRDLLNKGDQFVNYTIPDAAPFADLPVFAGTNRRYPSATDIMAYFSDAVNGRIRSDGVVSLSILGRQKETGKNLVLGNS